VSTLGGHQDGVSSVAWSHDAALLALASSNNTVKIWDAKTGPCVSTLVGHQDWVRSVAWSHDAAQLASASRDKTVKIWDRDTGRCLLTIEDHKKAVMSVAWSYDAELLASASHDYTVKIWDAKTGRCLSTLEGHKDRVVSVAWSHDAVLLASASDDYTVKIWAAKTGHCLLTLEVGQVISRLQFALADSSLLHTDVGTFHLQLTMTFMATTPTAIAAPHPYPSFSRLLPNAREGYGLTHDSTWIMYEGQNALWLPPEFRPQCSAISGLVVALGCASGRVLVFRFAKSLPWSGDG
jgi:hypothetical protein